MAITINKQPDGTYSVRVWSKIKDIYGKRKTKYKSGITTITAAKKWGQLTEDELTEISDSSIDEKEISFNTLTELYMKSKKDKISPTTYSYLETINPKINERIGMVKIKNINTRVIQDLVDWFANQKNPNKPDQKLKSSTINRYYRHIMAILNWAVGQDYLEYNRVKKIEFPKDEEEFEATTLSSEQAGSILKWLKSNYYNLYIPVLLSVTMSPRRGEFTGLTWDKVDFENDIIEFSNNRVIVDNEIINKKRMKSDSSKRRLVMSDFVKKELIEHKEMCKTLNSPYVCANVFTGETPTNPKYITKTFHKLMLEVFGINMRVHDLRHTFSQIAYEDDIDDTTYSKIMGHSKVDITRNVYTKQSFKKNKEAMNTVSAGIELAFNKN